MQFDAVRDVEVKIEPETTNLPLQDGVHLHSLLIGDRLIAGSPDGLDECPDTGRIFGSRAQFDAARDVDAPGLDLFYGGKPDAFNTTIGYFGPNDGDGESIGPGDPGYVGGRWKEDFDGDNTFHYFLCPLLGPGRDTP